MADWEVKKGNYGWQQQFTIKEKDGSVKDLTGYTVTLKVWKQNATSNKFSGTCTLDADPTTGICYYEVQEMDFDTLGSYLGELELTKTGEKIDAKTFTVRVKKTAPA